MAFEIIKLTYLLTYLLTSPFSYELTIINVLHILDLLILHKRVRKMLIYFSYICNQKFNKQQQQYPQ